jgi:hypothetical protein
MLALQFADGLSVDFGSDKSLMMRSKLSRSSRR